ncbi:hypothetical protein BVRB_5g100170 [Beta vulgaris subsp. vulgaris]|nr:hypothetical protein BVRB_5g100170 [Beta vulgaris subsp. vulgaris]
MRLLSSVDTFFLESEEVEANKSASQLGNLQYDCFIIIL